jgi:hypothetical protein
MSWIHLALEQGNGPPVRLDISRPAEQLSDR